jgi:hypothetical protein
LARCRIRPERITNREPVTPVAEPATARLFLDDGTVFRAGSFTSAFELVNQRIGMKNLSTAFIIFFVVLGLPAICGAVEPLQVPAPSTSFGIAASLDVAALTELRGRSK